MECNRDEAMRAKLIAEGKLEQKDFGGAKKFALKAQTLYPGLDGVPQMLTTLDVFISAENKVSGEIDWYGVLGVNPSADDEAVRKQYRKLALMLHPDKNRSVGADGAFKLISEAWSLLSDKAKRLAYNQRRSYKGFQQKVPMHTAGPSAPSRGNGPAPSRENGNNSSSRTTSAPKTQKNNAKVPPKPTPTPSCKRTDTFWTICHRCKMHYEYLKMYLDNTLLCPNCNKAFVASQTAPPFNSVNSSSQVPRQRQQASSNHVSSQSDYNLGKNVAAAKKSEPGQADRDSFRPANYQQVPLSDTANVANKDPSITAKAASVVQHAQDKLKRAYTKSNASAWEEYMKKRKLDDNSSGYWPNNNMAQGNGGFGSISTSAPGSRINGSSGIHHQPNGTRDLTPLETRNMLMAKAKKDILNKLNMWKSEDSARAACKGNDKSNESKNGIHKSTTSMQQNDQNGNNDLFASKLADETGKGQVSDVEDTAEASMNVPDPDFHDFDCDRSESSFGDKEVWAAYDDVDGMPRFYAMVSKVVSRKPFKLKISWINSKTNSEFGTKDWVSSGFSKTCGQFWVGRYEFFESINSFSQKVNWSKGPHGSVLIFPQKGDVWALYKNWSSDWDENTPDEVVHKYDMVTVLDDYKEEHGISVAPLVKVVGFKTVFRPNFDPGVIKWIPREEMFRFSHRVPHYLLTGQEAPNAPDGCLELDPAATPLELLQVITEANENPVVSNRANVDKEVLQSVPSSSIGEIAHGTNEAQAVNIAENCLRDEVE